VNARVPGVGCGAAIVRDGRLLLVKRRRPPEAGCWNLPGGKVDFGERVEDAIVREIGEEIGVRVALLRPLGVVQMVGLDGQHWVSPIHLAEIVAGVRPIMRSASAPTAWTSPVNESEATTDGSDTTIPSPPT